MGIGLCTGLTSQTLWMFFVYISVVARFRVRKMHLKWSWHDTACAWSSSYKADITTGNQVREDHEEDAENVAWMCWREFVQNRNYDVATGRQQVSLPEIAEERSQWIELVAASVAETSFMMTTWLTFIPLLLFILRWHGRMIIRMSDADTDVNRCEVYSIFNIPCLITCVYI